MFRVSLRCFSKLLECKCISSSKPWLLSKLGKNSVTSLLRSFSNTTIHYFRGKKIKTLALVKNPFFHYKLIADLWKVNEMTFYEYFVACVAGGNRERASGGGAAIFPRGLSIFYLRVDKNLFLQNQAELTRCKKSFQKNEFEEKYHLRVKSYHTWLPHKLNIRMLFLNIAALSC